MRSKCAEPGAARFNCVATARNSVSLTSVDLPEPDTPVTQVMQSERKFGGDVLEIIGRGARRRAACASDPARAAQSGISMRRRPLKYWPVIESGWAATSAAVPWATILPAMHARAGTQVHHVVGLPDGILVVLDHDDGVAEIAQVDQRVEQALIVALMQSDGGLIEDVHHADETRADLAREANALRLAAGKGVGAAIEREIAETHVREESEPVADFLDDLDRDLAAPSRQPQLREERDRAIHAERARLPGAFLPSMNTFRAARFSRVPRHSGQARAERYLASSSRTVADSVSR